MPEWFDPIMNSSLATGLVGFVCWAVVRLSRFFGPKITAVTEGHVAVMSQLGEAAIKQTALAARSVEMLSDHSVTLNVHGQILNVHSEQLRHIAESVGARAPIRQQTDYPPSFFPTPETEKPTQTPQPQPSPTPSSFPQV